MSLDFNVLLVLGLADDHPELDSTHTTTLHFHFHFSKYCLRCNSSDINVYGIRRNIAHVGPFSEKGSEVNVVQII